MNTWKVWIEIEKYDSELDEHEPVEGLEFASSAEFNTEEEAFEFARRLDEIAGGLQ